MTDAPDYDAIEARIAKATPGPWYVERDWSADPDDSEWFIESHAAQYNDPPLVAEMLQGPGDAVLIVTAVNALPALIARCRDLEAKVAGIEHANDIAAAHRFDLDPSGSEQELVDRLARLGEKRKGGPDNFYNGVQFATTRVRRAILDSKDPT